MLKESNRSDDGGSVLVMVIIVIMIILTIGVTTLIVQATDSRIISGSRGLVQEGTLPVGEPSMVLVPDRLTQGYPADQTISVIGTNTHFNNATTTLQITNTVGLDVTGTSVISVSTLAEAVISLVNGLTSAGGPYTVTLTTGSETVSATLTVAAASDGAFNDLDGDGVYDPETDGEMFIKEQLESGQAISASGTLVIPESIGTINAGSNEVNYSGAEGIIIRASIEADQEIKLTINSNNGDIDLDGITISASGGQGEIKINANGDVSLNGTTLIASQEIEIEGTGDLYLVGATLRSGGDIKLRAGTGKSVYVSGACFTNLAGSPKTASVSRGTVVGVPACGSTN